MLPRAAAESGNFELYWNGDWGTNSNRHTYEALWSSPNPMHITVTVTITRCFADSWSGVYAKSYVTLSTGSKEIDLYDGQTGTIEDWEAVLVSVSETPAYGSDFSSYYGISGEYELTILGSSGNGGGTGGDGTDGGSGGSMLAVGAVVAVVVVIVLVVLIFVQRSRKDQSYGQVQMAPPSGSAQYAPTAPQAYPPPPSPMQLPMCPNCRMTNPAGSRFCQSCGARLQ